MRYPLGVYEKDKISSKTGKRLEDITLSEVMKNHVSSEDIKISKDQSLYKNRGRLRIALYLLHNTEGKRQNLLKGTERRTVRDTKTCRRRL